MPKDARYRDASPHDAEAPEQPEAERPVTPYEREEQSGQAAKPSQAEGDREEMEEKGL
ncbi:MAG TPA: hypothetical protein VFH27_11035 [Longimicrobiaceae bacterium]|nr:hypothetical protein [Longimicrobiaceae bacterium]